MHLSVAHLRYMNIGKRYWNSRIDLFTESQMSSVSSYLSGWVQYLEAGMGVFLWGNNSVGKTYMSAALCKAVWGRYRVPSYMVTAEELKECWIDTQIEAHEGATESRLERVRDVGFLVIDDLAKEYRTESGFAENGLGSLLRLRQKHMKVTSITTNLSPAQFKAVYGESSLELIRESMVPCKLSGDNMRECVVRNIQKQLETRA